MVNQVSVASGTQFTVTDLFDAIREEDYDTLNRLLEASGRPVDKNGFIELRHKGQVLARYGSKGLARSSLMNHLEELAKSDQVSKKIFLRDLLEDVEVSVSEYGSTRELVLYSKGMGVEDFPEIPFRGERVKDLQFDFGANQPEDFASYLSRSRDIKKQRGVLWTLGKVINPQEWWRGAKDIFRPLLCGYDSHRDFSFQLLNQVNSLNGIFGIKTLSEGLVRGDRTESRLLKRMANQSLTGYWLRGERVLTNVGGTGNGLILESFKDNSRGNVGSQVLLIRDARTELILGEIGYDEQRRKASVHWQWENINSTVGVSWFREQLRGLSSLDTRNFLANYQSLQGKMERACPELYKRAEEVDKIFDESSSYGGQEYDFRGQYLKTLCQMSQQDAVVGFGEFMRWLPQAHQKRVSAIFNHVLRDEAERLLQVVERQGESLLRGVRSHWASRKYEFTLGGKTYEIRKGVHGGIDVFRLEKNRERISLLELRPNDLKVTPSYSPIKLDQDLRDEGGLYGFLSTLARHLEAHRVTLERQQGQKTSEPSLVQRVLRDGDLMALGEPFLKALGVLPVQSGETQSERKQTGKTKDQVEGDNRPTTNLSPVPRQGQVAARDNANPLNPSPAPVSPVLMVPAEADPTHKDKQTDKQHDDPQADQADQQERPAKVKKKAKNAGSLSFDMVDC